MRVFFVLLSLVMLLCGFTSVEEAMKNSTVHTLDAIQLRIPSEWKLLTQEEIQTLEQESSSVKRLLVSLGDGTEIFSFYVSRFNSGFHMSQGEFAAMSDDALAGLCDLAIEDMKTNTQDPTCSRVKLKGAYAFLYTYTLAEHNLCVRSYVFYDMKRAGETIYGEGPLARVVPDYNPVGFMVEILFSQENAERLGPLMDAVMGSLVLNN